MKDETPGSEATSSLEKSGEHTCSTAAHGATRLRPKGQLAATVHTAKGKAGAAQHSPGTQAAGAKVKWKL